MYYAIILCSYRDLEEKKHFINLFILYRLGAQRGVNLHLNKR